MLSKLRKIFKWIFLGLIIIPIITWLPTFSYRKEVNINPLPSSYVKGVYHIHSQYSDGKGDVAEIAAAASQTGVDFAILTDHGNPNRLSSMATSWQGDLLLIGGSELSLPAGHLAVVGYRLPDHLFPPEAQEAIDEVASTGGICFISHPLDSRIPWTDWQVSGFTGLEVFNLYSSARRANPLSIAAFPTQYLFNPRYALLNLLDYPAGNLKKWDELNRRGQYAAIFSSDAHAVLPITDNFRFYFPSYKNMFEIFQIYVRTTEALSKDPQKSARSIVEALGNRRFFSVVEAIAPANGFDLCFQTDGGDRVETGGASPSAKGRILVDLPFEFATHIHLIKDGTRIQTLTDNTKKHLEIPVDAAGVYRLEIFLAGHRFKHIPWILTNPFFLGIPVEKTLPEAGPGPAVVKILATGNGFFHTEHNPASTGVVSHRLTAEGEDVYFFEFTLDRKPGEKDFWSALANRTSRDISGFRGFSFEVRTDKPRRFWLEFRTGSGESEIQYRHSFLIGTSWRTFHFPFGKFPVCPPDAPVAPDTPGRIESLFFSIDNGNAYAETRGTLELKRFGLY